jgi:menaquinone-dependent protoporphyrinogen oxidase
MKVLVTAASKHGATMGIAEAIADELTANGLSVEVMPVEDVSTLAEYDAVILGSAIYFGRWLKSAVEFADLFFQGLSERPLWLFSSGPVEKGSSPASQGPERVSSPIKGLLKPRDHKVFPGALDKSHLNFAERTMMRVIRADYGDFRDWDAVRSWARTIAVALGSRDTDAD